MNKTIGKYEVQQLLGRGGMAEVYRAYHPRLNRFVAIKILHDFLADDPEFEQRFANEAQNIARLRHSHIVQVFDFEFEPDSGSYYMVMEYIQGYTLKEQMAAMQFAGQHFDTELALRIIREAASALAYAHRAGMIHRDVKPANLMLDSNDNDRVVLTDFGIAKLLTSSQYTITGGLIGTPAYMSPEQGSGDIVDERSDLYSLGIIFFQMVTGEVPYRAETPLATILQHLHDPIPSACSINKLLPPSIDIVIQKLLAKNPDDRYQSANELIDALMEIEAEYRQMRLANPQNFALQGLEHDTIIFTDTNPSIKVEPTKLMRSSSRKWWYVFVIFVVLLLLGGSYLLGSSQGIFPSVAVLASDTPTQTATATATLTSTPSATITPSYTPTLTNTPTETSTNTATRAPTMSLTPSATSTEDTSEMIILVTPSATSGPTNTATGTLNLTATHQYEQTATIASCLFDYAITRQFPSDGINGPMIETDTMFLRQIVFLNTGTCAWEPNASLVFLTGENFDVGPRLVISEWVRPGDEFVIEFAGRTPLQGRLVDGQLAPIEGIWQLRTRGQIPIGDPLTISVLVFNSGR